MQPICDILEVEVEEQNEGPFCNHIIIVIKNISDGILVPESLLFMFCCLIRRLTVDTKLLKYFTTNRFLHSSGSAEHFVVAGLFYMVLLVTEEWFPKNSPQQEDMERAG